MWVHISPWTVWGCSKPTSQMNKGWERNTWEIKMCVCQTKKEWGDKMLEFPAYCLGAGLAGAKWAQAPSGHVSTGLWGENSTDESLFIPTLTDAYSESERAAERKESISHYLTRARNLHNNSCASLCIDGLKALASLTKKKQKNREKLGMKESPGDGKISTFIPDGAWRHPPWQASDTNALLKHQVRSHWKPDSAAAVTCVRRETYLYSNAWGDIRNKQKDILSGKLKRYVSCGNF